MNFTDRFIKVPVKIYSTKEKELTGQENLEESWQKVLPFEISGYRPSTPADDVEQECTNIHLKNGEAILAYLPVKEFELLLNTHQSS